jgi:hypothetical protein
MAINFYEKIGPYISHAGQKYGARDNGATVYNYFEDMCLRRGAIKPKKLRNRGSAPPHK